MTIVLRWIFAAFVTAVGAISLSGMQARAADDYTIDLSHSHFIFSIRHLGLSYVYGRFNQFEGSYSWDANNLENCRVQVTIKADSVDTQIAKRDDHLRTPDFFDVKQYPEITFTSKKVTPSTDKSFDVSGDFTLHGVTRPVTFHIAFKGEGEDPWGGFRNGFHGKTKIKRSDFGMTHMIPGVGDEVKIIISIEGIKKTEKSE